MIKINKLYAILKKESFVVAAAALSFALIFWYQISPIAFKDYDTRCRGNYGQSDEYDRCMNPYRSNVGLNKAGLIASLVLTGIFAAIFVTNRVSRK